QAQMFIRAGSNTDRHVRYLAVTPGDAFRELKYLNAGFQHLIAGVGSAVWNSNTIAEERRGLLFARQHAIDVAFSYITGLHQRRSDLANRLFFVSGLFARMDVLYG